MDFITLPHPKKLVVIEPLDYDNTYNYKVPHRHNYFEVMLIETSGGFQFIDLEKYTLDPGQVYTIYPGQVHLLQRGNASGWVIQFKKDIFQYLFPLKHHMLYFSTAITRLSETDFLHCKQLTLAMATLLRNDKLTTLCIEKAYSYLKIILITLIENTGETRFSEEQRIFASTFLALLEQHIGSKRKVAEYAELLHCSTDKFTQLCKVTFGKTPLKLIHEELLIEIHRRILLNTQSLKEIAFELNFDSQANFSNFIKQQTGKTASVLQTEILSGYY